LTFISATGWTMYCACAATGEGTDKAPIPKNERAKIEQKTANTAAPRNFNFMARTPAAPGVATARILSQSFRVAN
jgi:hypothetical protein